MANSDGSPTPGEIAADAAKPQSVSVDGTSVTRASTSEQIAADRHRANNNAAGSPLRGLRLAKIKPGSAVNEG